MRLPLNDVENIRREVFALAGAATRTRLFGSRTDDAARGGDVDLLVECEQPVTEPAWLAARLSARISRALGGRAVDVVIAAPNLATLPIHRIARAEGIEL